MAYTRIPAQMQSTFSRLNTVQIPDHLERCSFYEEDLAMVRNQDSRYLGLCIDFGVIKRPDGETVECLVAFAVIKLSSGPDREWEERLDNEGDLIALSCPRYEEPKLVTIL